MTTLKEEFDKLFKETKQQYTDIKSKYPKADHEVVLTVQRLLMLFGIEPNDRLPDSLRVLADGVEEVTPKIQRMKELQELMNKRHEDN